MSNQQQEIREMAGRPGAAEPPARRPVARDLILLVTPGGLAQRGGMGSVVRTLHDGWQHTDTTLSLEVVDSWSHEWRLGFAPRSLLTLLASLARLIGARLSGRLAIVHVHMAGGGSLPRKGLFIWLGRALGARIVVHSAAADLDTLWARLPALGRRLVSSTLGRADAVVALGRYWQIFFRDEVGLAPERVVVIPNGVVDPGPPPARSGEGPCRLLFVGRLGARKGTPVLLEALAEPQLAACDWTLTLAGDGEVEAMTELAARSGLAERCRFTGWVDQAAVAALMRDADVLVLPSHQEGLPMAILEGMAHGLAIVTTGAGSIGDAVTHGENGLLTAPGDSRSLGAALHRLIVDADTRRALQLAARARYEQDYAAPLFVSRFADLYHRLLSSAASVAVGTLAGSAADGPDAPARSAAARPSSERR